MKRGSFAAFVLLILIIAFINFSVNVDADLVDWFSQDNSDNLVTGYGFFSNVGNWVKGLFAGGQVGVDTSLDCSGADKYHPDCQADTGGTDAGWLEQQKADEEAKSRPYVSPTPGQADLTGFRSSYNYDADAAYQAQYAQFDGAGDAGPATSAGQPGTPGYPSGQYDADAAYQAQYVQTNPDYVQQYGRAQSSNVQTEVAGSGGLSDADRAYAEATGVNPVTGERIAGVEPGAGVVSSSGSSTPNYGQADLSGYRPSPTYDADAGYARATQFMEGAGEGLSKSAGKLDAPSPVPDDENVAEGLILRTGVTKDPSDGNLKEYREIQEADGSRRIQYGSPPPQNSFGTLVDASGFTKDPLGRYMQFQTYVDASGNKVIYYLDLEGNNYYDFTGKKVAPPQPIQPSYNAEETYASAYKQAEGAGDAKGTYNPTGPIQTYTYQSGGGQGGQPNAPSSGGGQYAGGFDVGVPPNPLRLQSGGIDEGPSAGELESGGGVGVGVGAGGGGGVAVKRTATIKAAGYDKAAKKVKISFIINKVTGGVITGRVVDGNVVDGGNELTGFSVWGRIKDFFKKLFGREQVGIGFEQNVYALTRSDVSGNINVMGWIDENGNGVAGCRLINGEINCNYEDIAVQQGGKYAYSVYNCPEYGSVLDLCSLLASTGYIDVEVEVQQGKPGLNKELLNGADAGKGNFGEGITKFNLIAAGNSANVIDIEDFNEFEKKYYGDDKGIDYYPFGGDGKIDLNDYQQFIYAYGQKIVVGGETQETLTCSGTIPANAILCENDDKDLTESNSNLGNILVSGVNNGCTNLRKCEYYCKDDYEKQGTGENAKCVPKTGVAKCTGAGPDNDMTVLCSGDDSGFTGEKPYKFVASCGDADKCEYVCAPRFVRKDGNVCKLYLASHVQNADFVVDGVIDKKDADEYIAKHAGKASGDINRNGDYNDDVEILQQMLGYEETYTLTEGQPIQGVVVIPASGVIKQVISPNLKLDFELKDLEFDLVKLELRNKANNNVKVGDLIVQGNKVIGFRNDKGIVIGFEPALEIKVEGGGQIDANALTSSLAGTGKFTKAELARFDLDKNGDSNDKIDFADFFLFADAYGKKKSETGYDIKYNFDDNGESKDKIDAADLNKFVLGFGLDVNRDAIDAVQCVKEGESLGAVVPGNNANCCEGLISYVPVGVVGSRGNCVKPADRAKAMADYDNDKCIEGLENGDDYKKFNEYYSSTTANRLYADIDGDGDADMEDFFGFRDAYDAQKQDAVNGNCDSSAPLQKGIGKFTKSQLQKMDSDKTGESKDKIDMADVNLFKQQLGNKNAGFDYNNDGNVDDEDFFILASGFGQTIADDAVYSGYVLLKSSGRVKEFEDGNVACKAKGFTSCDGVYVMQSSNQQQLTPLSSVNCATKYDDITINNPIKVHCTSELPEGYQARLDYNKDYCVDNYDLILFRRLPIALSDIDRDGITDFSDTNFFTNYLSSETNKAIGRGHPLTENRLCKCVNSYCYDAGNNYCISGSIIDDKNQRLLCSLAKQTKECNNKNVGAEISILNAGEFCCTADGWKKEKCPAVNLKTNISQEIGIKTQDKKSFTRFDKTFVSIGLKLKPTQNDIEFNIKTISYNESNNPTRVNPGKRVVRYIAVIPDNAFLEESLLLESVNLTITYLDAEIPPGVNENSLKIYYLNPANQWGALPSTLDIDRNNVNTTLNHLSIFGVFSDTGYTTTDTPLTPPAKPTGEQVPPGGGGSGGGGGGGSGGFVTMYNALTNQCVRPSVRDVNSFEKQGYKRVTSCPPPTTIPPTIPQTIYPRTTLPTIPSEIQGEDSDNDGLPDSWEDRFFGNLKQLPKGDFDKDGFNNLEEYVSGTDPGDAESKPKGGNLSTIFIVLGVILVIVVLFYFVYRYMKKNNI